MNEERLVTAYSSKDFVCNELASCSAVEIRLNIMACSMWQDKDTYLIKRGGRDGKEA